MRKVDTTFTITMLNNYIKTVLDNNFALQNIAVRGEVSNFKAYPSGHAYFALKDNDSVIKAVMFSSYVENLKSPIKNGDEVIAFGHVSVYPARGEYQLYVQEMELFGDGNQLMELEKLKRKLAAEGLFDESRKRKINIYANTIGVISAANSAAMADIKTNLLRRNPLIEVVLFPSLVQGEDAPKDLLRALNEANLANIDTLIIGRGGGSSEDLSAFNDEELVRAVAKFKVPVISAVGHEIDYTLIDFVADARASTPTGAAELATFDKREIYQSLDSYRSELSSLLHNKIDQYKNRLLLLKKSRFFENPKEILTFNENKLTNYKEKLNLLIKHHILIMKEQLKAKEEKLESLSPKSVLKRGYSLLENEEGIIIKSVKQTQINQKVKMVLSDGNVIANIVEKENTK